MTNTVKPIAKYLLGFCAAVESCGTKFATKNINGYPIYSDIRFQGYAAAYHCQAIQVIVLFGPIKEMRLIKQRLIELNVPAKAIRQVVTNVSTYANALVMKNWIRRANNAGVTMGFDDYILSSSGTHVRAQYFAGKHKLPIRFIPAEAFLFAAAKDEVERLKIFDELRHTFAAQVSTGNPGMTEVAIDDWKGLGTDIADDYKLPHKL